jgi:hypothetical protein
MKKIIEITVMTAAALTAAWNINQSENEIKLSDLALDNVEALASREGGSGWWCCGYWGNCKSDGGSYIHGLFRVTPC